jgi:RND superfamily putative drug exporter
MKLFGKWNWYLPSGVARVLRVQASPLGEHRPRLRPAAR